MRVGGDTPKQFLELAGRPMIVWSLEAIFDSGIADVVVVVPEQWKTLAVDCLDPEARIVAGGPTRQDSVRLGLQHVTAPRVVIHDAARPFAPPETFAAVTEALEGSDGVVPGLQMQETAKIVRGGVVVETLDRQEVWNIQTPQAFWTDRLRDAHERAVAEGFVGTDDAQLIEHYGGRVQVVAGHPDAFKVTTSADVRHADQLAERSRR